MSEKSHAQSIADALFRMIQTAKEQGVAVDKGFRNQAMSEPDMTLAYLFLNKTDLFKIPANDWSDNLVGAQYLDFPANSDVEVRMRRCRGPWPSE